MVYLDYKEAAERHLETCFELVQAIIKLENKKNTGSLSSSDTKRQTHILENLYYLSGYMLECLYGYAMCKQDSYPQTDEVKDLDNASPGTYKLCYKSNKKPVNKQNVQYSLERPQHRMSLSELSFFDDASNGYQIAINQNIPLVHGNRTLSNINIQKLFENWSAYERYKFNHDKTPNLFFNSKNIIDLFWEIVDVCAKMSEYIIREITLFRRIIKKRNQNTI